MLSLLKISKQNILWLTLLLVLAFSYWIIIDDLLNKNTTFKRQLLQQQKQISQMQYITKGSNKQGIIPIKGSILSHISRIRNKYKLSLALEHIEVKKKTISIVIKSANYQSLVLFLNKLAQSQIVVEKISLNNQTQGLVSGKLSLVY